MAEETSNPLFEHALPTTYKDINTNGKVTRGKIIYHTEQNGTCDITLQESKLKTIKRVKYNGTL